MKLKIGFRGERFIHLPVQTINQMAENPISKDLFITSIGYFPKAEYHYITRPEGCDDFILILCTSGKGWVTIQCKKYRIISNQFIIIPKSIPHGYGAEKDDPWSIYWIHFRGEKAALLSNKFSEPTAVPFSENSRMEDKINTFEEIFNLLSNDFEEDTIDFANITFYYFLGSLIFGKKHREAQQANRQTNSMISRITHYMNEHIERNLTINEMSNYLGLSPSHFHRKFFNELSDSPINYFHKLKMNKAGIELITTKMTVSQIALKYGYTDTHYFSRLFKKILGVSPLNFRRNCSKFYNNQESNNNPLIKG